MEGLTELEASIGPSGYPSWMTQGADNMGWFRAELRDDAAMAALDKARNDGGELQPGQQWVAVSRREERDDIATPDE